MLVAPIEDALCDVDAKLRQGIELGLELRSIGHVDIDGHDYHDDGEAGAARLHSARRRERGRARGTGLRNRTLRYYP
eukprot:4120755-Prymnesium_polylepis.1